MAIQCALRTGARTCLEHLAYAANTTRRGLPKDDQDHAAASMGAVDP